MAEQLPHGARSVEDLVQLTELVPSDNQLFPAVAEAGGGSTPASKTEGQSDWVVEVQLELF